MRSFDLPERLRKPWGVLVGSTLWTLLLAIAANLVLERWQGRGFREIAPTHHITAGAPMFWLGTLVVWLVVLLILTVVGRLWITTAVVAVGALFVGFANHEKLVLRLEPLYPSDLAMAGQIGFLSGMINFWTLTFLIGVSVLVTALSWMASRRGAHLVPRIRRANHPRLAIGLVAARVVAASLLIPPLVHASNFNGPGNRLRAAYEAQGAHWRAWNQSANYVENGFVGGLLYNTEMAAMDRPAAYGRAAVDEVAERYSAAADAVNAERRASLQDEINLVMVLGESFSDPTRLKTIDVAEDPIPFTRNLMTRTISGNMLATQFGGGTANMEFAALTGMSLSVLRPQVTTPYQMLVPGHDSFPSLVGYLENLGYHTTAIHPSGSGLYRRAEVYRAFGFDEAYFLDDVTHRETLEGSRYVSDDSAFKEVIDEIERQDRPAFVSLVTIQNHYPMAGSYADPIPVSGLQDDAQDNAEAYARGLRYTDEALQRLIGELERSEEKTVVLFYGDHLPPLWPADVRRASGVRGVRETPFFVYSNFGGEHPRALPTTSPIHFANLLLERADLPLPPYYALLQALHAQLPAMERRFYIGPDDRRLSTGDLPQRAREVLEDYRLVQYDLAVGERYGQADLYYAEPGTLR